MKPSKAKIIKKGDPNHKHIEKITGHIGRCECGFVKSYPHGEITEQNFTSRNETSLTKRLARGEGIKTW